MPTGEKIGTRESESIKWARYLLRKFLSKQKKGREVHPSLHL